ncbi:MAG: glycosyltransferase family 4 protein [Fuerstia sp.]|nr:glycosyltransferase family 4 protein [Fuerstiella sp.]
MHLFLFGWPSLYGGADTKSAHLLNLLAGHCNITVIPNDACWLDDSYWVGQLAQWGVRCAMLESLPQRLDGIALALSNDRFFAGRICSAARHRGLKIVWSSEMMWHHPEEVDFIKAGEVDRLLYVSEVQKQALNYESFCDVPTRMTGNYVSPDEFPFVERSHSEAITIGRLSRADVDKYPEDFPVFYEALQLPDVRFRVMAWSPELAHKYRWHRFDERWTLLPPLAEPAAKFLQQLDLFVYPLGHTFTESWGRSTVEAMLTGAIPLVPDGHNFRSLIVDGETGFICRDFRDYQSRALELSRDFSARQQMSRACREHAARLNNADTHRAIWLEALDV